MTMKEKIEELERRLDAILPEPNEDGVYGDGSHEHYAGLFESAYDSAESVARNAIALLKKCCDNGSA